METATQSPRSRVAVWLAGLQAGMLGVLTMLAWLGLAAKMQRRSFWMPENLMASVFYGDRALVNAFVARTMSGLALYLLLYSALGALFAAVLSDRQSRLRILLLSLVFALAWYYVSFNLIWRGLAPLLWLLYSAQPMILGHLVYGTFLGQYPAHLPKAAPVVVSAPGEAEAEAGAEPVPVAESAHEPAQAEAAESHESNPAAPL